MNFVDSKVVKGTSHTIIRNATASLLLLRLHLEVMFTQRTRHTLDVTTIAGTILEMIPTLRGDLMITHPEILIMLPDTLPAEAVTLTDQVTIPLGPIPTILARTMDTLQKVVGTIRRVITLAIANILLVDRTFPLETTILPRGTFLVTREMTSGPATLTILLEERGTPGASPGDTLRDPCLPTTLPLTATPMCPEALLLGTLTAGRTSLPIVLRPDTTSEGEVGLRISLTLRGTIDAHIPLVSTLLLSPVLGDRCLLRVLSMTPVLRVPYSKLIVIATHMFSTEAR